MAYDDKPLPYSAAPGLSGPEPHHRVVVVGAGPVGLTMALNLARLGIASVVLEDKSAITVGSRAIVWSQRSLQFFARLGIADRIMAQAVPWSIGRISHGDVEIFSMDMAGTDADRFPPFANLQQYHVEDILIERALAEPLIDLRFRNRLTGVDQTGDGVELSVKTPDGSYRLTADYLLACDGARSLTRALLDLDLEDGAFHEERFMVADIEMEADFPAERWFWFDPSFHSGQSAMLMPQADNIYRIDLQLGRDANVAEEVRPDRVIPRIQAVVGPDFDLEWVSVYTFQSRRLAEFVHGRVIFLGDAAHLVPPFSARGANAGLRDVENLGWKLAAVLEGRADEGLLDSYNRERVQAADENLRDSARSADFISPAPGVERLFRDQVLALARKTAFAREWVNAGRLAVPCIYRTGAPDDTLLPADARPGAVAPEARIGNGWLLDELGTGPMVLAINCAAPEGLPVPALALRADPTLRARYLGDAERALYLIRPDRVVAARWITAEPRDITAALRAMWEGRE
ncbi:FAD-dependent monooxygenase [Rhodovulum sulfidophilum]|nr:FAD-dependent monooxygenase [Rhodovulum sulfidophilum]